MADKEDFVLTLFHFALMNVKSTYRVGSINVKRNATQTTVKRAIIKFFKSVNVEKRKERFRAIQSIILWSRRKRE